MMTTERVTSGVAGEMERGRGPDGSAARQRPGARRAACGRRTARRAPAAPAAAQRPAARPDPGLARLQTQFAELARVTDGTVGGAVVHLESGRAAYFNRGERFPMASTVKVPLACSCSRASSAGRCGSTA